MVSFTLKEVRAKWWMYDRTYTNYDGKFGSVGSLSCIKPLESSFDSWELFFDYDRELPLEQARYVSTMVL